MEPHGGQQVGARVELGRFTFTPEEIVRFARLYDPQPFHVDAKAAEGSPYGGLIASGWHTVAVWMGLFVRAHGPLEGPADAGAPHRPEIVSPVGVGFGLKNLRWIEPVRAGDEIVFFTVLDELRPSASRPGWAIYARRGLALRPDGTPVTELALSHLAPTAVILKPRITPPG